MNRLSSEKSPYLLQHAHNPVDWYPWGEEAFAKAGKEDKPIFLSIGYATCHWCHVMEHESFEDEAVAALMNELFVCIKVDREERPDIDQVYMTVCQMMTGSGGWPLTVIMTPERKPFFAGTYFPKSSGPARVGMIDLLPSAANAWTEERERVVESAEKIAAILAKPPAPEKGPALDEDTLKAAFEGLRDRYDPTCGGFARQPKFPTPHNFLFLLRYWARMGDEDARDMVVQTLKAMRRGGIWDHVGLGFHRYATDREWLVPHFEKMLYDQAMLALACTEAWQATADPEFEQTAREILTYVLRDMTSPDGGFYSAEDADSEGEEGKFYVWSLSELKDALGERDAEILAGTYHARDAGNYRDEATGRETGANILHLSWPEQDDSATGVHRDLLDALFEVRETRVHPLKDDKILVNWNGVMIAAMARAGVTFGDAAYVNAAERAATFILCEMTQSDGRLLHRYRDGEKRFAAHLDDYAFLIWGLLELYQATLDAKWLKAAVDLHAIQVEDFWDDEEGGFFFSAAGAETLIARPKEIYDGALPSGNSVAFSNALRLSRLVDHEPYAELARRTADAFSSAVAGAPDAYTMFMVALDAHIGPSTEVVICGSKDAPDTQAMLHELRAGYRPDISVLFRPDGGDASTDAVVAPHVAACQTIDGQSTAYVCKDFACSAPVTTACALRAVLEG